MCICKCIIIQYIGLSVLHIVSKSLLFTPTDLAKAKLVDKEWKISVSANKSVTLELEVGDKFEHYIKIGEKKSCKIEGKL